MKRVVVCASIALSLLSAPDVRATDLMIGQQQKKTGKSKDGAEKTRSFVIRVEPGDWGNAKPEEIEILLYAIADKLLTHFPQRQLDPIIVSPTRQGPIVLYQKGPENQYQVHLAARDRRWAEYVYEFSHEMFHILAHYENHAPPRLAPHLWFEEALCEAVSLYTLQQLSASWEQMPPRAEWVSYAPILKVYTGRVLNESHRQLPTNTSLAQWFRDNGPLLLGNPYLRGKNELVANLFLPVLEHSQDWQAVGFLNPNVPQEEVRFYDYLAGWYNRTPAQYQEFPRLAMRMFQFDLPDKLEQGRVKAELKMPAPAPAPAGAKQQLLGAAGSSRE